MIQTIINEPKVLASNSSPITFDDTSIRTRCAYNVNFSASVSSATAGVVAIGLYEDGILIPDTVRAVTIGAADDYETVSFNRKLRVCPRGNTSITVGSVPSVPTPTTPATPIETQIPIITNATFNLSRSNT